MDVQTENVLRDDFSEVILVALSPGKALLLKLHNCSSVDVSQTKCVINMNK